MPVKREGPGVKRLEKILVSIDKYNTQVGWFPGAKYEDGEPVALVAATNEYGSPKEGIPPRPFMRTTITDKKTAWIKLLESGSRAIVNGKAKPRTVMEGLGLQASGDIRKKITKITSPPLSPVTVEARRLKLSKSSKTGSLTKPLVETGLMLSSLTFSVENK